jgi:phosphoglycolate phosphatase
MISCLPNCILFDLDGTLLDSLPGIEYSVRAAFVSCNLPPPQKSLRELIGPPIRTILSQALDVVDPHVLDALEQAFRHNYDSKGWRKTVCFPAVNQVLEIMHERGYRLFVISNKPRHISLQILEAQGILDLFEMIVTRDSRSPAYSGKEEMIRTLLNESGIASEDCLYTADTTSDAEAASAIGIRFAYMAYGYGEVPEGTPVSVECRFDNFQQFLPLMAKELIHD